MTIVTSPANFMMVWCSSLFVHRIGSHFLNISFLYASLSYRGSSSECVYAHVWERENWSTQNVTNLEQVIQYFTACSLLGLPRHIDTPMIKYNGPSPSDFETLQAIKNWTVGKIHGVWEIHPCNGVSYFQQSFKEASTYTTMYLQSWDLVWLLQLVSCPSPCPSPFLFLVGFQSFPQSCSHWTQGGLPWPVCLLRRINKRVYISWVTQQLSFQFNCRDPLLGTTLYCINLVPRLTLFFFFCSSICVQYTRRRKHAKNGEGLGTPVTWWTWGGRRGRWCPTTNWHAINQRVSFLPVKSNTVDLMNAWSQGYHWSAWSAWWWSLVRYLNVNPSPPYVHLASTRHHSRDGCSQAFPIFCTLPLLCIIHKPKNKKWDRPGNEAITA